MTNSLNPQPITPDLAAYIETVRRSPGYLANQMMHMVIYQIIRRMTELNMTQAALAAKMGVSGPQVNRLLRAQTNTSLLTIAKAARALDLSFGALKLIPDDQMAAQIDEFVPFVEAEHDGAAEWWPSSRKPSSIPPSARPGGAADGWAAATAERLSATGGARVLPLVTDSSRAANDYLNLEKVAA